MFLVVFRFSWCNYSLIILYDGKTELESILEEKFLKRHETAVVDVFSGKVSISDSRGYFFKQLLIFYSLKIPSPDEEREVDLGTFVDQEESDIDDESDVDLDLDLDLDSEHNDDDLESDSLLSDSVDRAWSAEEFQWSLTLPEQVLSLTILIYYTPCHQLRYSNFL